MLPIKLVTTLLCIVACIADGQDLIERKPYSMDSDQCLKDDKIAEICLKCNSISFRVIPSVATCCSDKTAFLLCEACVDDRDACEALLKELEKVNTFSEDRDDNNDYYDDIGDFEENDDETPDDFSYPGTVEKRFGKLFVNRHPKRYGKIFFGKRSVQNVDYNSNELAKRFGRIFMERGSYFGKRSSDIDKRYGRLFTNSNSYFGKRTPYSTEHELIDENSFDSQPEDLDISKRYGRIYMGNRRNKMYGKRYGSIFFGKRSNDNVDKRFGTLHMSRNGYYMRNPDFLNMDKRYGRLFTGRSRYYFGK